MTLSSFFQSNGEFGVHYYGDNYNWKQLYKQLHKLQEKCFFKAAALSILFGRRAPTRVFCAPLEDKK